jgi:CubicO group peptidase (beta-lactamase class C family)
MNRHRTSVAVGLLLLLGTATAWSDRMDDYVRAQMRKQQIPGLALAIMRDGQLVRVAGYGLANVELNVPVTLRTIFQSGSVGKQFTATAVMMLVEEGKIRLDDPITQYFDGAPEAWQKITVRHLLNHTSGIGAADGAINLQQDLTEEEWIAKAASVPVEFAPGEKWQYSNTGYAMLGFLIRKVTGMFYGDFLRERIFVPLGMGTARIISEADIIPNRAAGYRLVNGVLKNQEWVAPFLNTTADGALYLTILDMAKWDAALYAEKLLKRASLEQMWTPTRLNNGTTFPYGFGWFLGDQRGHTNIWHSGQWQGFSTYIGRYVDDRLTVVALCNLGSGNAGGIARAVAGLYQPALLPPTLMRPRPDPDPQRTRRLLSFLADLGTGSEREATLLTPARQANITPEERRYYSERVQAMRSFAFLGSDDVRTRDVARYGKQVSRVCYYRLGTATESWSCTFYLTEDDTIAEFALELE